MKENGYVVQEYKVPVKRYCQTMDLKDNPELIAEYVKRHSEAEAWSEIRDGIREVGILEMEIYILGTRLFMIVETPLDLIGRLRWRVSPPCLVRLNGKPICLYSSRRMQQRLLQRNGN